MQVMIIKPSGSTQKADIPNSLKDLQETVGGGIETITLSSGRVMIIGADSKTREHYVNEMATMLARDTIGPLDYIAGTAIIANVYGDEFTDLSNGDCVRIFRKMFETSRAGVEE